MTSIVQRMLHAATRAFARKYKYDTTYMHRVIDISTRAGIGLALLPAATQYMGPKGARAVWSGALLASTLDGDCGPCAQLVVQFGLEQGTDPKELHAAAEGRFDDAGATGLGFRFAQHAISGSFEANPYGPQIRDTFGDQALVAASFAAATGRIYPVLKRGLGIGETCQRLDIDGQLAQVSR